ncbi:aldo/keto reductase family oxidoreductase, putative [Eimeria tenella]|uniref:Aldo/keto reductase family oxidoreductase, putative n=1 Tax=Eimeria tenella TaxID=5802 RepID=U6KS51_EIMTE|nr:aldo/keto reductase family oxidoreductase, putative [Eimeria tenella]CDJ39758.1 aldo/keto reductase family oxidoreductase, putative [Eimeria tenella]|eukprot:XP_013230511.1 aldo/keto reductase family oxidoreductase, putative [Eimeria tenella]
MGAIQPANPYILLRAAGAIARTNGCGSGAAADLASEFPVVKMPRIIYGTAWKKERTAELCHTALREGFRGFDTACQPKHYNQRGLGEALSEAFSQMNIKRDELYIQTKFTPVGGQDPNNIPYDPQLPIPEQVEKSIQVSLKELGLDYIDAVLLHSPLDTMEETLEAWRGLEAAVDSGYVRVLGISNCYSLSDLQQLHSAAKVKPAIVQNRFYAATGYDAELRAWCRGNQVVYQGFWTLTANPHILRNPVITRTASRLRCTPEQLWFRYLIHRDIVPLAGPKDVHHMEDDTECVKMPLLQSVCDQLDAVLPRSE